MICCETCEVWQHGECMGVTQANVPDLYYCEKCQPNHKIHEERRKLTTQFTRKARKPAPKRRGRKPKKKLVEAPPQKSTPDDPPERLTREQRKIQNLMLAFQKLEDRQSRKPSGKGRPSTPAKPDTPRSQRAKNRSTKPPKTPVDRSTKRQHKRKRPSSTPSTRVIPTEQEVQKARTEVIFSRLCMKPPTPMYLGKKHWLLKEHRAASLKTHSDYNARLHDDSVGPVYKRVQYNFIVQQRAAKCS